MNAKQLQAAARLRQIAARTGLDAIAEEIKDVASELEAGASPLEALQTPEATLARVIKAMGCPADANPVVWAASLHHAWVSGPDPIAGHDDTNSIAHTQALVATFPKFPG